MVVTITADLREALGTLKGALISVEDSGMHPAGSEMHARYQESAAIRMDFAQAHLRHARYMATSNFTFTETFREETGESFVEQVEEFLYLMKSRSLDSYQSVTGRGRSQVSAVQARISRVESLLDAIDGLIENEYLPEEP